MRFNREALLAATEAALKAHRAQYENEERLRAAKATEAGREWSEKWGPQWDKAALRVRRLVKAGKPITEKDLPDRHVRTFTVPWEWRPQDPYCVPAEVVALRNVLKVITDEEVSPHNLREMGITSATLREAVRHMATTNSKED